MLDYPVYLKLETEKEQPFFEQPSSAEAVIASLVNVQRQGWIRLHAFVLLPNALEMVASLIKQGVSGTVAQIQAETIPLLSVLQPAAGFVWSTKYESRLLTTQRSFDARLEMIRLSPIANDVIDDAANYPYSSYNARYSGSISIYAGFKALPTTGELHLDETTPFEKKAAPSDTSEAPVDKKPVKQDKGSKTTSPEN